MADEFLCSLAFTATSSPILSATTASKLVEYFSSCEGERGESGERVRWRDGWWRGGGRRCGGCRGEGQRGSCGLKTYSHIVCV